MDHRGRHGAASIVAGGMENRTRPLISVVLPSHERMAMLREAVESVRAQTYRHWQLIVVDDGSTDGGPAWVRSLGDERITVTAIPHSGRPALVRNAGIARAKGDYIAFIDSDDRWRRDKLELQVAHHLEPGGAAWSYTGRAIIDAAGTALPDSTFTPWRPVAGDIFRKLLLHEAMISLPTVMVRRQLLEHTGGFDESLSFSEDYDLWLRLAQLSPCGVLPPPLTEVRVHSSSATWDRPEVNASFMQVYARVAAQSASRDVRRICRRQRSFYAVHLGRQYMRRGEFRDAAHALWTALRGRPVYPPAWRSFIRLCLLRLGSR